MRWLRPLFFTMGILGVVYGFRLCMAAIDTTSVIVTQPAVKKNVSRTALKEDIADSIKETLRQCAALTREIGEMQQKVGQLHMQLASVQSHLYTSIERLADNKGAFKKAHRPALKEAAAVMQNVKLHLGQQVQKARELKEMLEKDACLKIV